MPGYKITSRNTSLYIKRLFYSAFLCSIILYSPLISAQSDRTISLDSHSENKFTFENYTTKNGLSQNAVYKILQDKKGFVWFATQDGLNRFNGYEFTTFHHVTFDSASLPHSFINGFLQDSKDRFWVCTEGGLALYNPLTETFTNYFRNTTDRQSTVDNYVWTIFEDSKGTLWIGTKTGLVRFDPDKKTFEAIKIIPLTGSIKNSLNVGSIYEDSNSNLWIGTRNNGLFKINEKQNKPVNASSLEAEQFRIGNNDVRIITEDSFGSLFVGTFGSGLYKYNAAKKIFDHMEINPSNTVAKNPNAILTIFSNPVNPYVLWLGTEEDGIILINTKLKESIEIIHDPNNPNSLSGNMVYSIYRGVSGIIWVGSNEGINKVNLNENKFEHIQRTENNKEGLSDNAIGKIIEDHNGLLWVCTDGGGINKIDRSTGKFTHYLNDKNNPASLSSDRAMIVFEDHTGIMWIGTFGGGLNKFNRDNETFEKYTYIKNDTNSIGSNYITSIVEDKSGYLWIGTTSGGLNRFDPKTKKFKRYLNDPDDPQSISDNFIWILYIDKAGVLWAGTKSNGLNEMTNMKNGKFKRYLHSDKNINGINHNSVHAIFEDHSDGFWIGTPGGLNKLDRKTGEFTDYVYNGVFPRFRVIGILEDDQNRLWLMSEKALIRFNPRTNEKKYYDAGNGMPINDFRIWANYKNKNGKLFVGGANGFAIFQPDNLKDNKFIPPIVIDGFERFNIDTTSGKAIIETGIPYRKDIELSYKDNIFSFSFAALNYINTAKNQYSYKLEGFNKDWINLGSQQKVTFTNIDAGKYTFKVKGSNDDGIWNEKGASIGIIITPPFWETWWFRTGILLAIILSVVSYVSSKLKAVDRHHKEQEKFARQLINAGEQERQRIANELHDSLGQNLLAIKNNLLVKQQLPQVEGKSLEEMSNVVSNTIREVRSISHNLRPHLLDQLGLTKTLKSLGRQIKETSGINLHFEIDDLTGALASDAEINLFRIVQEGLNNIVKHSGAEKAYLVIVRNEDTIGILIKDEGKGMDINKVNMREEFESGFGLSGLSKRAHVYNWKYEIKSELNIGTEIKITIPISGN